MAAAARRPSIRTLERAPTFMKGQMDDKQHSTTTSSVGSTPSSPKREKTTSPVEKSEDDRSPQFDPQTPTGAVSHRPSSTSTSMSDKSRAQRARRLMSAPNSEKGGNASVPATIPETVLLQADSKEGGTMFGERGQHWMYIFSRVQSSGMLVPMIGFTIVLLNKLIRVTRRIVALEIGMFLAISYTINHGKGWISKITTTVNAVHTYFFPPPKIEKEKEVDLINWSQKLRVFVGGVGSQIIEAGKGGHLSEMVATPDFRDALLEYANQFWLDRDKPEHVHFDSVALEIVDYGDIETKSHDGKVTRKSQKKTIVIPLQTEAVARVNISGIVDLFSPLDRHSAIRKFFAARWAWLQSLWRFCIYFELPDDEGGDTDVRAVDEFGFAPLTESGDIRLGIGKPPKEKRRKKEGGDGDDGDELALSTDGCPIYLDIYGDDGLLKAQKFVHDVNARSWRAPKEEDNVHTEHKQLFWYTMSRWDSDGRWPIFKKSPIYGDREYQLTYHHAFFHPKKNQLLGNPQALLDQFTARTGNYSVLGASQKLNFLFFGPPGTGKSKLVRTMAMYMQRHVVSFQISQVETEENLLTLLDDLQAIRDNQYETSQHTFKDLLFVVEEIDADPRGICLQRKDPAPQTEEKDDDEEKEDKKDDETEDKPKGKKQKSKQQQQQKPKATASPPLSLGLLLRTLDGGSETPGRIICMTTNRVDMLDEAFKRPGRLKKVQLENLAYAEFKQMIWHFRHEEGGVPTSHLWTLKIDEIAGQIMEDYKCTQAMRTGDLDKRGLGLSPAMLEELCMDSLCLQQLFEGLVEELMNQWGKVELQGRPRCKDLVDSFDWRMNTVRQSVMYYLTDPVRYKEAVKRWPEAGYESTSDVSDGENGKDAKDTEVTSFMRMLLNDEMTFNDAIEVCPTDHGGRHEELRYRLQVELVLRGIKEGTATLAKILTVFMDELVRKWKVAWATEDVEMQTLLDGKELPDSLGKFQQLDIIKKKEKK